MCKHKGALWADDICSGATAPRSWCCYGAPAATRDEAPRVTVSLRYKRVEAPIFVEPPLAPTRGKGATLGKPFGWNRKTQTPHLT